MKVGDASKRPPSSGCSAPKFDAEVLAADAHALFVLAPYQKRGGRKVPSIRVLYNAVLCGNKLSPGDGEISNPPAPKV